MSRREVVAVPGAEGVVALTDDATVRPVDPGVDPADLADEVRLRPRRLEEFLGQAQLTEHLHIVLEAARRREQPVDHLLFAGPPGWARPRWPASWRPRWESACASPQDPPSCAPATWPPS